MAADELTRVVGVGPLHTGIFNVADAAMLLGAWLVMSGELRRRVDRAVH